jgi:hypothetical protein
MTSTRMPATAPHEPERRIAPRLRAALGTVCKFEPREGADAPTGGLVWNLSLSGMSVLTGRPPKPGEIVSAELADESGKKSVAVLARVVHAKPTPTGDYLVGASFFRELTPVEIRAFVKDDEFDIGG